MALGRGGQGADDQHPVDGVMRPENYVELLTHALAELADRLRLCSEEPAAETTIPACTARLDAVAALLRSAELRTELGPLAALGDELADLLAIMRDCPGRDLGYLGPALELLAGALENTLRQLDQGASLVQAAGDPEWLAVLSRLANAGTPLEIMDELDAGAKRWENRWCDEGLSPGQEAELHRRWLTFRAYGDAMFGSTDQQPRRGESPETGDAAQVVLLVESVLRREHLLKKLRAGGLAVQTAATAAEAAVLAASSGAVRAILCDDLEPSRNLSRLSPRRREGGGLPALVLVTGGSGNPAEDLRRARSRGADGVWTEPFNTDPFANV